MKKGEPGMYIELDERRRRLLRLAIERGDRVAIATLRPSKPWTPEPDAYPIVQRPWAGIRWSVAA